MTSSVTRDPIRSIIASTSAPWKWEVRVPAAAAEAAARIPTLAVLDDFNRLNANNLNNGTNWQQLVAGGSSGIRVNDLTTGNASTGTALCSTSGLLCALGANAYWNATTFGTEAGRRIHLRDVAHCSSPAWS